MAEQDKVTNQPKESKTTPDDFVGQSDPNKSPAQQYDLKNPRFPFWYPWANSAALLALSIVAGLLAAGLLWGLEASSTVILIGGFGIGFLAQGQARPWVTWPYPITYVEQVRTEQAKKVPQTDSSVREIVDTVVFVIVLVLMLKSFVAEAFIIPTGSMADTLWGYQKDVTCGRCGFEFPVNATREADPKPGEAAFIDLCICPNCRQKLKLQPNNPSIQTTPPAPDELPIKDPGWKSGDRVIVVKYIYDFQAPKRLDVVVFKYPEFPRKDLAQQNYIKRLIGLPGETIVIHGGDIYYLEPGKGEKPDTKGVDPNDLWQPQYAKVRYTGKGGDPDFWRFWGEHKHLVKIVRKDPESLLAMRRIVYDNNHPANDLKGEEWQRWNPQKGTLWKPEGEHGFRHSAGGQSVEWLHYHHRLRQNSGKNSLITDFLAYNAFNYVPVDAYSTYPRQEGLNWVGDLMIECEVDVEEATGTFVLALNRGQDHFTAKWDLSTGTCTLYRERNGEEPVKLKEAKTDLTDGKHRVRFANFDRQLTVWVDGDLPFGSGVGYQLPRSTDEGPSDRDFEPASIGVKGADVHVSNITLWRDTYYATVKGSRSDSDNPAMDKFSTSREGERGEVRRDAEIPILNWKEDGDWNKSREYPTSVMYVQPGHYLCLGDNSLQSSDSRTWGVVPQRLMLGRALSVYWPIERFGRIR